MCQSYTWRKILHVSCFNRNSLNLHELNRLVAYTYLVKIYWNLKSSTESLTDILRYNIEDGFCSCPAQCLTNDPAQRLEKNIYWNQFRNLNCKKVNGFSTDVIITCMVVKQKQKKKKKNH